MGGGYGVFVQESLDIDPFLLFFQPPDNPYLTQIHRFHHLDLIINRHLIDHPLSFLAFSNKSGIAQ